VVYGVQLRLLCAVGHTTTSAVNVALVVSQTALRVKRSLASTRYQARGWRGRKDRFSNRLVGPGQNSNPATLYLYRLNIILVKLTGCLTRRFQTYDRFFSDYS